MKFEAADIFGYKKYWAQRFGPAPELPMSHGGNAGIWVGIPAILCW